MSLGYAQKLSYREDVGVVGMSEVFDTPAVLQSKIEQLALMLKKSKHVVAFTGAGISTSCGIPDFRGPKGVWTLQRQGKGVPEASLPFHRAVPSLTHMALTELERAGLLKFVISQNIDSLHLRSGIPREKLAELHGNSFMELCPSCGTEYLRDFELETLGMKVTPRRCSVECCGAKLRDTVLDWGDALKEKEMCPAEQHCKMADIVLCLGTSLQITPACNLPLKSLSGGGRIVIVNLQATPKDKKASLIINGHVDKVIAGVMHILNLKIPPFVRIDFVHISLKHAPRKKAYVKWILKVVSVHGSKAPLPFVKSVEISFPERPDMKAAFLTTQPFVLRRETARKRPFTVALKFNFSDGCRCSFSTIFCGVNFQVKASSFIRNKDAVLKKLRDDADHEPQCGQHEVMERQILPRSESSTHAITTNIVRYNLSDATKVGETSNGLICMKGNNGDEVLSKKAKY